MKSLEKFNCSFLYSLGLVLSVDVTKDVSEVLLIGAGNFPFYHSVMGFVGIFLIKSMPVQISIRDKFSILNRIIYLSFKFKIIKILLAAQEKLNKLVTLSLDFYFYFLK